LNDNSNSGRTITDRFRWGSGPFFSDNILFGTGPVNKFLSETGIEGVGKYPALNTIVNIQSFKDSVNTGRLDTTKCNRVGYLISSTVYDQVDLAALLAEVEWLTISTTEISPSSFIESGNFLFSRAGNEILYLVWDYADRLPVAVNDSRSIIAGQEVVINVLNNDTGATGATVTIITPPAHGEATVNGNNTITYNNDGTLPDSFVYQIENSCGSDQATVTINQSTECLCFNGGTFKGSGNFEYIFNYIDCFNVPQTVAVMLPENPIPANEVPFTVPGNICVKPGSVDGLNAIIKSLNIADFCVPTFRQIFTNETPTELSNCDGAGIIAFPIPMYVPVNEFPLDAGSMVYYDTALTNPVDDKDSGWLHRYTNYSFRLDSLGSVTEVDNSCGIDEPEE
ncbi:MAG TPA: Ig-like domain-containing protein, partial [Flavobacterium sp.]